MKPEPKSEIILYQTEDNRTRIEVRLENETVWLSQAQIADLFQRERSVITKHIRNVFEEGELVEEAVCASYAHTAADGKTYQTAYYNLDVIISVGYRVKSPRGTQFRIWATQRLREYIVKGFTLDDERLKQGGTRNEYYDELLQRIREIRLSERNFYRKICDIYQTSIDYDPSAELTQLFFQTVQNKMHWAVHGQTAAEVIHRRANAAEPHMGLTAWKGAKVRKPDVAIAKNYLTGEELKKLSLIVIQYLDFAELQALERRPMTMRDWIAKLDALLRAGDRQILERAGSISADEAKRKAELEFEQFDRQRRQLEDAQADAHFDQEVENLAKKAKQLKPPKRKKLTMANKFMLTPGEIKIVKEASAPVVLQIGSSLGQRLAILNPPFAVVFGCQPDMHLRHGELPGLPARGWWPLGFLVAIPLTQGRLKARTEIGLMSS